MICAFTGLKSRFGFGIFYLVRLEVLEQYYFLKEGEDSRDIGCEPGRDVS